ncbi:MAG: ATP-binding protein, partial [Proteobacteria bacterium]
MLKELFIDRKQYLGELTNGLKHGKDYILIAPRRFGKTTLAHEVLNRISDDSQFMVIAIDFMRYSGSVQSIAEAI